jgi:ABC-type Fe3+/spermidine/putrescine transport system ATPase subunit
VRRTTAGVATIDVNGTTVSARVDRVPSGKVIVGIRPEKVRVVLDTGAVGDVGAVGTNEVSATVVTRMQLGNATQVLATTADGTAVTATVARTGTDDHVDDLQTGDRVRLSWAETAPIVLAA